MLYLVRYGEIALKSAPVRRRMEKMLVKNIRSALGSKPTSMFGRIYVETDKPELLERIFGIVSFSPCHSCRSNIKDIIDLSLELSRKEKFKTFAVKTKRIGKHSFSSNDVNIQAGKAIRLTGKKVDLSNPDKTFWIEVRDKKTYIYTKKIQGLGGFPLGTQGKIVCYIKDKRDLLASWMLMRRGCEPILICENNGYIKLLEKWANKKLKSGSMDLLKKYNYGVVTTQKIDFKPLYNPLMGLESGEEKKLLNYVNRPIS